MDVWANGRRTPSTITTFFLHGRLVEKDATETSDLQLRLPKFKCATSRDAIICNIVCEVGSGLVPLFIISHQVDLVIDHSKEYDSIIGTGVNDEKNSIS